MISFFRRALSSWVVLGLLALVLIAFIITGVNTPGGPGGGDGAAIAKVDGSRISGVELLRRLQNQLDSARREQPTFDRKTFLATGGFEGVTDALIAGRALERWGGDEGFRISKRLIDAEIAAIPAFRGVTGQFDETTMRTALAQARISEKELRADIAADLIRGQILTPAVAATPAPASLAKPYAGLLLEQRVGSVAIIPFAAVADPRKPSEPEIAAAYKANLAAYTRPEARVLRYALFGAPQVAAQATPTEAEVATYYRENATAYAARESRTLSQVIAPSEAVARSIAAAAKAGAPLSGAAAKAGLEASSLTDQNRAAYGRLSNEAIAGQVFTAAKGGVIGPAKGAFGWYVVRVEAIGGVAARTLDQVRPEIVATLSKQKAQEALSELGGKIEDAVADGASFAEVAAANKLSVTETPAVLADGAAVDQPGWKAPPELAGLLKPGFEASADDRPTVETIARDQQYALLSVVKIVPPTPLPLAQVHDAVARDLIVKRAAERARAIGERIAAAVNKGVPIVKAMSDSGAKLPPLQPARASQIDLARAQQSGAEIPAPVRALFGLQKGKARLTAAERGGAMFVTVLDNVVPANPAAVQAALDVTRQDLARNLSPELSEQFMRAVQQEVKIQRYPDAIAAVRRQFSGAQ